LIVQQTQPFASWTVPLATLEEVSTSDESISIDPNSLTSTPTRRLPAAALLSSSLSSVVLPLPAAAVEAR